MLFHELTFLFVFLPVVAGVCFVLPARLRNPFLLVASVFFYAVSSLAFLPVLFAAMAIDYVAGARIAAAPGPATRRAWLVLSVTSNLLILGFFKYAGLVSGTLADLGLGVPVVDVALPVGISFYTFQSMSYAIDLYRGKAHRARSLTDFALYVTMFPQLIAGPIVRYVDVEAQLVEREETPEKILDGVDLFVVGLAKKLLLADTAAAIADPIFTRGAPTPLEAWVAVFAYAAQIYYDFAGYSDMARGLGRMFGFEFPKNFDSPYQATSFQDFWRRWHITLSTWLRDNLYIPLGGSRHGTARTVLALAATMLLGGLWHGASWSFLVWGGLHGLYLGLERALRGRVPAPPVAVRRVIVLLGVLVAWVFFRIEDVGDALRWLSAMAGVVPAAPWSVPLHAAEWVFLGVAWAAALLLPNADAIDRRPTPRRIALTVATLVVSLVVGQGRGISPFLYFRF